MRISDERAQQVSGLVWATVWMWPLIGPADAIWHGQVHPLVPAVAGLVVFLAAYLMVIRNGFNDRKQYPAWLSHSVLTVLSVTGLALSAVYTGQPDGWLTPLMYVAVCGGVVLLRPSQFLTWLAFWCVATVVVGMGHDQPSGAIGAAVFGTVLGSLLVFAVRQMVGLIRELRSTQRALAETAVAQERLRFSRDLHDLLGHTLSLMVVKAELARRLAPTDAGAAAREAGDIETIGRRALAEVREAVTGYRERVLAEELGGARAALTDAGIEPTVGEIGTPLPRPVDDVFAWAVREGVTNVIRHSGASRCWIEVHRDGERASLAVLDNGARAGVSPPGNGLRGLAERLDALGGSLTAQPRAEGGFGLRATVGTCPPAPRSTMDSLTAGVAS